MGHINPTQTACHHHELLTFCSSPQVAMVLQAGGVISDMGLPSDEPSLGAGSTVNLGLFTSLQAIQLSYKAKWSWLTINHNLVTNT